VLRFFTAKKAYEFDPCRIFQYATAVNLEETRKNWTALGEHDAMWVVLTDPAKKGNRWTPEDFFATGQREVADIFARLQQAGVLPATGHALDFGCGLGRLSQALATRFESVDGVDISSSMIRQAADFNKFPSRVNYHVNPRDDLATFATGGYDFICSMIALQHIPPRFQNNYLRDFLRLLKPGGAAYFQTVHARGWRKFIPHFVADKIRRWRSHGQPFIPLYGIPAANVHKIIEASGGKIISYESAGHGDWGARYFNDVFIVKKL
jgi:2-polyprenyl-3-methyl-5-hydroxy-6-metoxy-1,4-benzoquinol methylase